MMPSANTVAREKPPPANRSYRLNSVPCPAFRRKSASACTFTPGVASHLAPVGERRQVPHVDHLRRLPERVREAALGDAPDERHLAALESGASLAAGPRRLPLSSPAGRLTDP